jgi:glutathione S-transferase
VSDADELLHIAMPDDWAAARLDTSYRMSTRGRTLADEGFIHCSTPRQVEAVANRFYRDVPEVVLLHLEPELLGAEVRLEPAVAGGNELFPHVYGPIPTSAVVATTWWERDDDGVWRRPSTL